MHPASSVRPSLLLAHSYYLQYDLKQQQRSKPYPPLGTLLAAAYVRQRGYNVQVFDAMLAGGVEEFVGILDATCPAIVGLIEDSFNFLTKMCTTTMRDAALRMIRAAKVRGCRIAVNGSDASDRPETYLAAGADAVILGEPEQTLGELLDLWSQSLQPDASGVRGLAVADQRSNGAPHPLRLTGSRPPLRHLDDLPLPAWDLVDVERYRRAWVGTHGRLSWNMVASRGCPYRCNWCAKPIFGTRYAQRSPAGVAEELALLRDTVHPDHIWFADDIFGLTGRWIESFAREVAVRQARTPFMMQSRVNLMRPPVVAALRTAGAEEVWLGVESGSQAVLDGMEKGTAIEQVRAATRALHAEGIRACWFIQLGYLGEEWDDILRTRDLIREERPDDLGVSVSYPLPGTRFHETVAAQLGMKTNWVDSDDLDMMFAGTYPREIYRAVRDLLHHEAGPSAADEPTLQLDAQWRDLATRAQAFRRGAGVVSLR